MNVTYRKLRPADASAYRNVRLESLRLHPESFGASFEEQSARPELRLETSVRQRDPRRFVVGAYAQGDLIGTCSFIADNDAALERTGTLIQMYVRAAFSGQKVGLGLVQATLKEAFALPEIERAMLEVNTDNRRAVRVYEQVGFRTLDKETLDKEGASVRDGAQLMVIDAQ